MRSCYQQRLRENFGKKFWGTELEKPFPADLRGRCRVNCPYLSAQICVYFDLRNLREIP